MKSLIALIAVALLPVAGFAESSLWKSSDPNSNPILDRGLIPDYSYYVGFIPDSNIENFDKTAVIEIGGNWEVITYEEAAFNGDVDINVNFDITSFLDDGDLDLPNQVTDLYFDLGWTYRVTDLDTLQLRAMPGVYSDLASLDGNMVYIPVSAVIARNFTKNLSGIIGAQLRGGFDQMLMPIVGVDWQINNDCRLNARLPHSSLIYRFNEFGSCYLGFKWQNMSYGLDDGSRDQITLNDFRFYGGASCQIADGLYVFVETGKVFNREISFGDTGGNTVDYDVENALTMRFGLHGPF